MEPKRFQELIDAALRKFDDNQTKLACATGLKRTDICRYANGYFDNPGFLKVLPLFAVFSDEEVLSFVRKHVGRVEGV